MEESGSESDSPFLFDPYDEYVPDFDNYNYRGDSVITDPEDREVIFPDSSRQCYELAEQGIDPQPTLKSLLEAEFRKSKPQPDDESGFLPSRTFTIFENGIGFHDSAFISTVITSMQNCKRKEMTGYLIIPVTYCSRLRSRKGNHGNVTKAFYLEADNVDDSIRAFFE